MLTKERQRTADKPLIEWFTYYVIATGEEVYFPVLAEFYYLGDDDVSF